MIWVASYCRVSTDKEDQANSFEAQQRYFREYIDRQPEWELYKIYADEGITGTSTKKRMQFNQMIQDARIGKFQLIVTKEVSRFSRNILDTITYTRELKALAVGVIFMNDGINTMDMDAELRLCIMGSIAQEESRRTSSRVKWGQSRQMERGVVFGHSLLGYDVEHGQMTVNPAGAEIVRQIFHKYGIEKKGVSVIARELREAGLRTRKGSTNWTGGYIQKILRNEKYVGDLIQKKTYTPDYLTHEKKSNHGAEEKVCLTDHHEPIIDRALWNSVQAELARKNRRGDSEEGHGSRYIFSGKIRCGECGASFVARKRYCADGSSFRYWSCYSAVHHGRKHTDVNGNTVGCDIGWLLREDDALEMLQMALNSLQIDREALIRNVTALAAEALQAAVQPPEEAIRLKKEIEAVSEKKLGVLDAYFSGKIKEDEMRTMRDHYDAQLQQLQVRKAHLEVVTAQTVSPEQVRSLVENILTGKRKSAFFLRSILHRMVVYKDKTADLFLEHLPMKWVFTAKTDGQQMNKNRQ